MTLQSPQPSASRGQHFDFDSKPSKKGAVYVNTHSGGAFVTPADFMAAASALNADFCYTLADETFAHVAKRRADNAVKRTRTWLDECLEHRDAGDGSDMAMIGSICGAAVEHAGPFAAAGATAADDQLAGAKSTCASVQSVAGNAASI
jgi:tRNA-guanine family transglycosylase